MIRGKQVGLALWGAEPVPRLVAHAQLAESIGLDNIWVIDSQLLCREVTVTLAACLAATTRLHVASGVTQPATRHPSVAASALATLHEMSGGRALMGIGTGFSSLRTIGMPAAKLAEVETFVDTMRRLLRKQRVVFGGTEAELAWLPAPIRAPIVVAASGPRMTRAAPRFADGIILHHGVSAELLNRALDWLREGTERAGRSRPFNVSVWVPYALAADPRVARDSIRPRVAGALVQADPTQFHGAERAAVERLQASYDVGHHASAGPEHAAIVTDSLVDRYAVAGTSEEVCAGLGRLLDHPAVDRVILNPQISGAGAPSLEQVLRDLAREVLPAL
jgi:5,10-methylenetetrahydromethanopterin reductase